MKEYIVTCNYAKENKIWIVLAKDSKDAINQVYKAYVIPLNKEFEKLNKDNALVYEIELCKKENLVARSIGSLHNQNGKIINIT